MARSPPTRYPWGTVAPGVRLRDTSNRLRKALETAASPGYRDILSHGTATVAAVRPLLDALEHLSVAGFRTSRSSDPIACEHVRKAISEVQSALGGLASSSILDVSDHYREFTVAAEALLEVADAVTKKGIARPESPGPVSLWNAFDL